MPIADLGVPLVESAAGISHGIHAVAQRNLMAKQLVQAGDAVHDQRLKAVVGVDQLIHQAHERLTGAAGHIAHLILCCFRQARKNGRLYVGIPSLEHGSAVFSLNKNSPREHAAETGLASAWRADNGQHRRRRGALGRLFRFRKETHFCFSCCLASTNDRSAVNVDSFGSLLAPDRMVLTVPMDTPDLYEISALSYFFSSSISSSSMSVSFVVFALLRFE